MPVCANGSEPKPGTPDTLWIDYNHMLSMMPPQYEFLRGLLQFLPPITIQSATFCATDPPNPLELTLDEAIAIASRSYLGIGAAALTKLMQFVQRAIWYEICQCSDLASPTPIGTPTQPTDWPEFNPPGISSPTNAEPCLTRVLNWIADPYWSPAYWDSVYTTPPQVSEFPMPNSSAEYTDAHVDIIPGGTQHTATVSLRFDYYGSGASPIGQEILTFTDGQRRKLTPTAGALRYQTLIVFDPALQITDSATVTIRHYCSVTGPGSVVGGCCPPDPIIGIVAAQILELVTLIQRQVAPFATIDGTTHAALTGEGEIAIQGLVGVRVAVIDTMPGTVTVTAGHPETLMGAGWIRWGDLSGWRERVFLSADSLLSTPYAASAMTKIGYSLPPGAEIDITELEREP